MDDEARLLERARNGESAAFDAVVALHRPRLRSYLHRLIAHPEDADDLAQDTAEQAFGELAGFRGEPAFATWLFAIAHRLALRHLRTRKQRWPATIQLEMHDRAAASAACAAALSNEIGRPDFHYEVNEHIAYCFSCVGRSLDPEDSAAVILRDVLDVPDHEAAKIVDQSEPAFQHRLAAGRSAMIAAFGGLCGLVNKQGACKQCSTLRGMCPVDRRGPEVEPLGDAASDDAEALFARRIAAVRAADLAGGPSARMHAVMLRFIARNADPRTPG